MNKNRQKTSKILKKAEKMSGKFTIHDSRDTLHASRNCPLHLSRTLYKSALFMQNEPNFQNAKMNVTSFITKSNENKSPRKRRKNKAKTNPIKPNLLDAQMNVTKVLTKYYENKSRLQTQAKQSQNKPNQTQFQTQSNFFCGFTHTFPAAR